ncbi:hypothetical protein RHSIM_Rhsim01G0018600 [Rhododendron simsii]|uniref:FAS1 domain-containing protein n=1 Tax=Rhododendron simsii TaxID=118357 RepID=A0A834HQ62_RHOSS|nr:hypothetical protein RHSIM_Rhsim01G0018600 [Rhododendron simsii]
MSIILKGSLSSLLLPFKNTLNATAFTIFCPPDKAFFTPNYPQPPLTPKYHIVPSNLDRESLESFLRYESKIETLLPGHPVVVTTAPHSGHASINGIKVTEWDMYNDGRVIVHGVEDFFDPVFQTLLYPWHDNNNNSSNKNGINKGGVDEAVSSSSGSATPWRKDMTVDMFIMLAVVSLAGSVLSLVFCYWANRRYSEYSFISTETGIVECTFNAIQSSYVFCEVTFGRCSLA